MAPVARAAAPISGMTSVPSYAGSTVQPVWLRPTIVASSLAGSSPGVAGHSGREDERALAQRDGGDGRVVGDRLRHDVHWVRVVDEDRARAAASISATMSLHHGDRRSAMKKPPAPASPGRSRRAERDPLVERAGLEAAGSKARQHRRRASVESRRVGRWSRIREDRFPRLAIRSRSGGRRRADPDRHRRARSRSREPAPRWTSAATVPGARVLPPPMYVSLIAAMVLAGSPALCD